VFTTQVAYFEGFSRASPIFDDFLVRRRDLDVILLLIRAEVAAELAGLRLVEVDHAQLGPATPALEAGSVKLKEIF